MKYRHPLFLTTVLLATGAQGATLKPLPPRGTFLYSSLWHDGASPKVCQQ